MTAGAWSVPWSVPWVRRHRAVITPGNWRSRWEVKGRRMDEKRAMKIGTMAAVSFAVGFGLLASPASSQSLGDRFKSLFGGKPDATQKEKREDSVRHGSDHVTLGVRNQI